jgi:hypothetical protein
MQRTISIAFPGVKNRIGDEMNLKKVFIGLLFLGSFCHSIRALFSTLKLPYSERGKRRVG